MYVSLEYELMSKGQAKTWENPSYKVATLIKQKFNLRLK